MGRMGHIWCSGWSGQDASRWGNSLCKSMEVTEDGSSEPQSQGRLVCLASTELLLPPTLKRLVGRRLCWSYSPPPPQHPGWRSEDNQCPRNICFNNPAWRGWWAVGWRVRLRRTLCLRTMGSWWAGEWCEHICIFSNPSGDCGEWVGVRQNQRQGIN